MTRRSDSATRRSGRARVGCSGWAYPDWRGVVYPADLRPADWFGAYADRFDTVEINNTFYRLPTEAAFDRWAAQAPSGFLYAVKLGGYGSHRKKLRDPDQWLANHVTRVRRLGAVLGPNLVQLPRAGSVTSADSTPSSPRHRATCGGRSSSGIRRGCTTTCTRCWNGTGPRSACTISWPTIRGS